jgi:hypothetical protein
MEWVAELTDINAFEQGAIWALTVCRVKSKRFRRSAKKAAVFMAASFSETAVATNWLMLIPSALAGRATSAFTKRGEAERVVTLRAFRVLILLK